MHLMNCSLSLILQHDITVKASAASVSSEEKARSAMSGPGSGGERGRSLIRAFVGRTASLPRPITDTDRRTDSRLPEEEEQAHKKVLCDPITRRRMLPQEQGRDFAFLANDTHAMRNEIVLNTNPKCERFSFSNSLMIEEP